VHIYLVVENLQLGGYQRLALDQAYCFSKMGHSVSIISMAADSPAQDNLEKLEEDLIVRYKVRVIHCGGSRFRQLNAMRKLIGRTNPGQPIIVHSLRASVLIYLIRILFRRDYRILTTIHQLPSLSAPLQRLKRYFYAQFCDFLFAYSEAVKLDWESRLSNSYLLRRFIFRKKIIVLRNGIFLDRLPEKRFDDISESNPIFPKRIVYLGRVTSWKGLSKFYSCVLMPEFSQSKILMIIPSINSGDVEKHMEPSAFARTTVISGKTILAYSPSRLDLHFYPVEYPRHAKHIESISLNCLEMACLGVRSFVSTGGLGTWPDLVESGIFIEIDWNQSDGQIKKKLDSCRRELTNFEVDQIRSRIDIRNQINAYLRYFEL
jgi:hypothetical protein